MRRDPEAVDIAIEGCGGIPLPEACGANRRTSHAAATVAAAHTDTTMINPPTAWPCAQSINPLRARSACSRATRKEAPMSPVIASTTRAMSARIKRPRRSSTRCSTFRLDAVHDCPTSRFSPPCLSRMGGGRSVCGDHPPSPVAVGSATGTATPGVMSRRRAPALVLASTAGSGVWHQPLTSSGPACSRQAIARTPRPC